MLSDGWEAIGVGHGLGFALMNFAWAPGNASARRSAAASRRLAGDVVAYGRWPLLCLGTFAALRGRVRRPRRGPGAAGGR